MKTKNIDAVSSKGNVFDHDNFVTRKGRVLVFALTDFGISIEELVFINALESIRKVAALEVQSICIDFRGASRTRIDRLDVMKGTSSENEFNQSASHEQS